jgi:hypothetical protein
MSNIRIVFERPDGGVSVVVPAQGATMEQLLATIPADALNIKQVTTDDLPTDRIFRNAWAFDADVGCKEDHAKCLLIAHEKRRSKRAEEFAPHDEIIAKQIPGKSQQDAETARAAIRTKYDGIQTAMDATTTPSELKTILEGM